MPTLICFPDIAILIDCSLLHDACSGNVTNTNQHNGMMMNVFVFKLFSNAPPYFMNLIPVPNMLQVNVSPTLPTLPHSPHLSPHLPLSHTPSHSSTLLTSIYLSPTSTHSPHSPHFHSPPHTLPPLSTHYSLPNTSHTLPTLPTIPHTSSHSQHFYTLPTLSSHSPTFPLLHFHTLPTLSSLPHTLLTSPHRCTTTLV